MKITKPLRIALLIGVTIFYIYHAWFYFTSFHIYWGSYQVLAKVIVYNTAIHLALFALNYDRKMYRLMGLYVLFFILYVTSEIFNNDLYELLGLLIGFPFLVLCPIYLLIKGIQSTFNFQSNISTKKYFKISCLSLIALFYPYHLWFCYQTYQLYPESNHILNFVIMFSQNTAINILLFILTYQKGMYRLIGVYILFFLLYITSQMSDNTIYHSFGVLISSVYLCIHPLYLLVKAFQSIKD